MISAGGRKQARHAMVDEAHAEAALLLSTMSSFIKSRIRQTVLGVQIKLSPGVGLGEEDGRKCQVNDFKVY